MEVKKKSKVKIVAAVILFFLGVSVLLYYLYPAYEEDKNQSIVLGLANEVQSTELAETEIADRINFAALTAENPDTVGWVNIEGTPVEYPVMQSDDNDFYLHHNFYKEASVPASIFLDYLCNSDKTRNYVLYGHYMSDESMFGSLWNYQDPAYLAEHPIIQFDMPGNPGDWEIFTTYTIPAEYEYRQPEFIDDNDFFQYVTRLKENSSYPIDVEVKPTDTILTLSTCIYTFDDARFVVQARKITD